MLCVQYTHKSSHSPPQNDNCHMSCDIVWLSDGGDLGDFMWVHCGQVRAMSPRKVSKRPRPNSAQKRQIIILHKFLARSLALGDVKSQKYLYKLFVCILVICTTRNLLQLYLIVHIKVVPRCDLIHINIVGL